MFYLCVGCVEKNGPADAGPFYEVSSMEPHADWRL